MRIYVLFVFIMTYGYVNCVNNCELHNKGTDPVEEGLLARLSTWKGRTFQTNNSEYTFYFSICDVPSVAKNPDDLAGLIQQKNVDGTQFVIGRLSDVDLAGGDEWIQVTYRNGDNYGNACNKTSRKAAVFLICDPNTEGEFRLLEENYHSDDCAYFFELKTSLVCSNDKKQQATTTLASTKPSGGLGVFSILVICVFSVLFVYLIVGVLYLRFVRKQRGWQQVPNFKFWNRIGNMQADLCDLVCRCNGGRRGGMDAQPYESLSGQLSDDENILNL